MAWFPDAVGFDPGLFGVPRLYEGKSGAGKFGDAMMEHDFRVGQVLDAIKEAGIEGNTLATIAGGDVPNDLAIDGVDQTPFFLGEQEHSNRESVIFFAGDQFMAVKWRQFKIYVYGEKVGIDERGYNRLWAPEAYNLELDPKEQHNLAMQNLWLLASALKPSFEYVYSVQKYGLILPGGDEPEVFDAELPFYSAEALELAMGAIKKEAKIRHGQ